MVMKSRHLLTTAIAAAGMLAVSSPAMATNGYFTHGVGTQSKGIDAEGASTGMGTASNPALGAFVSDKWEIGLSIFSPRRSYTASSSQLNGQPIGPSQSKQQQRSF